MNNLNSIHYERSGSGNTALVFIHGWLGSSHWWAGQQATFSDQYTVLCMDLPGHGRSPEGDGEYSSASYAAAIKSVVDDAGVKDVVLIGHSMAGAYALEASLGIPCARAVVLVDTLKNVDQLMTYEAADRLILNLYRTDFKQAVEHVLPKHLFASTTPAHISDRLKAEFLSTTPEQAVAVIEPLYKMDILGIAKQIRIPIRAINSDFTPTDVDTNRRCFRDYEYTPISDTGHYPMLERPQEFNRLLDEVLRGLAL